MVNNSELSARQICALGYIKYSQHMELSTTCETSDIENVIIGIILNVSDDVIDY